MSNVGGRVLPNLSNTFCARLNVWQCTLKLMRWPSYTWIMEWTHWIMRMMNKKIVKFLDFLTVYSELYYKILQFSLPLTSEMSHRAATSARKDKRQPCRSCDKRKREWALRLLLLARYSVCVCVRFIRVLEILENTWIVMWSFQCFKSNKTNISRREPNWFEYNSPHSRKVLEKLVKAPWKCLKSAWPARTDKT